MSGALSLPGGWRHRGHFATRRLDALAEAQNRDLAQSERLVSYCEGHIIGHLLEDAEVPVNRMAKSIYDLAGHVYGLALVEAIGEALARVIANGIFESDW